MSEHDPAAHALASANGPPRHAIRSDRLLPALVPQTVRVDDRGAADLLLAASAMAPRLIYHFSDGRAATSDWQAFTASNVTFLLADMATVDAVQEFMDAAIDDAEKVHHALLSTLKRLDGWRARARDLRGSTLRPPHEVTRAAPTRESVESALYDTVEKVYERELLWHTHPEARDVAAAAAADDDSDAAEARDVAAAADDDSDAAHERARTQYLKANRVTRLLSDLAGDFLEQALNEKSDHQPHVALLLAFVQLLRDAKVHLNGLAERHLDFYYRDILQLSPAAATADATHVAFRLNPQAIALALPRGTRLSAVADAGRPVQYALDDALVVTGATLDAVRALYVERRYPRPGAQAIGRAPVESVAVLRVADSPDDLAALAKNLSDGWPTFGAGDFKDSDAPTVDMDVGLVITSPLLLLREGQRRVRVTMTMSEDHAHRLADVLRQFTSQAERKFEDRLNVGNGSGRDAQREKQQRLLHDVFLLSVSGPKGYVAVPEFDVSFDALRPNELALAFTRTATDPPICRPLASDDPAIAAGPWPSLIIRLNPAARVYAYTWVASVAIASVVIHTAVSGLTTLNLQGPQGPIPPGKPFPFFGVVPERGAYLLFANDELWHKPLDRVRLHVEWANLIEPPDDLENHYDAYDLGTTSDSFRTAFSVLDGYRWVPLAARPSGERNASTRVAAFPRDGSSVDAPTRTPFWELALNGRRMSGAGAVPGPLLMYAPAMMDGFFRLELMDPDYGFAHKEYPGLVTEAATDWWRITGQRLRALLRHPPYTPMAARAWIDYEATGEITVMDRAAPDPADMGAVFHLDPFGHPRPMEPGGGPVLPLDRSGYLYLGFKGARAGEVVALYLNILEGTPDGWCDDGSVSHARSSRAVRWRYLTPAGWREFRTGAVLIDGTQGLNQTGIVSLELPADLVATSWGDAAERFWIEISVPDDPAAYGRIIDIRTQGVAVTRVTTDGDVARATIPAGTITRLAEPLPAIAGVVQPVESNGGRPAEDTAAFRARVSERLRHKHRAILPRDYESLVLDQFPTVGEACCIAQPGGRVVVVVVPLRDGAASDPSPRVKRSTCRDIAAFLRTLSSPCVREVFVRSPWYEPVKITVWLTFENGRRLDGLKAVASTIDAFLAPWRTNSRARLTIGSGAFSVADLRAHLESHRATLGVRTLGALSVVHHFREYDRQLCAGAHRICDSASRAAGSVEHAERTHAPLFRVGTPWSVFVPATEHRFLEAPEVTGIGVLEVGQTLAPAAERRRGTPRSRAGALTMTPVPTGIGSLPVGAGLVVTLSSDCATHPSTRHSEDARWAR